MYIPNRVKVDSEKENLPKENLPKVRRATEDKNLNPTNSGRDPNRDERKLFSY